MPDRVDSLVKKLEQNQYLAVGGRQEYTGRQFLELVDIAEALQQKMEEQKEDMSTFSESDLEGELISLDYQPEIIQRAIQDYKKKELQKVGEMNGVETSIADFEKYNALADKIYELENKLSSPVLNTVSAAGAAGALAGLIAGFDKGVQLWGWGNHLEAWPFLITFGGAAIGAVILGVPAYFIARKIRNKQLHSIESQLEELKESQEGLWEDCLEKIDPGDFVIVKDNFKYRIAYVREVATSKVSLVMSYTQTSDQSSVTNVTRLYPSKTSDIVSTLKPQYYAPLTSEEVRILPLKSPFACVSDRDITFGFLDSKNEMGFGLYSDHTCLDQSASYQF